MGVAALMMLKKRFYTTDLSKYLKISLFVGKGHSKKAVTVRFIEEYLVFKWWAYTKMSILHSVNLRRWKEIEFCHLASGP